MRSLMLITIGTFFLNACTDPKKVYRPHQDTYCDENLIYLPYQGNGRKHEGELSPIALASDDGKNGPTPAHCYFQQHAGSTEPATRAHRVGKAENPAHRFNLAFVELGEDGRLLQADQLARLKKSLQDNHDAGKRNHVIMFVHGWRHDADLDNANVRTFRTLLNYSSSFVAERDDNAVVTGVYVGWRGRLFRERTTRSRIEDVIGAFLAAPTFPSRKKASEDKRVVERLFTLMNEIHGTLNRRASADAAPGDSFMVVGHSFGGNMIATAVQDPIKKALDDHTPGDEFVLPFADLIVLINPAAEAAKMNDLQREIRKSVGLPENKPSIDFTTAERQRFQTLFPVTQPPRYLSLTSTRSWSDIELQGRHKPSYDFATGFLFPIGQRVFFGQTGEQRVAIGHHHAGYYIRKLEPEELKARNPKTPRVPRIRGPRVGASHDMVANQGPDMPTGFNNAERPQYSACPRPEQPWLYESRRRQQSLGDRHGRSWDTGYRQTGERAALLKWELPSEQPKEVHVQIRHSIAIRPSREDKRNAGKDMKIEGTFRSVAPANSPIWITRAFDNVITNHGGFQNYAMWCALSQMVLDDVAAKAD